MTTGFRRKEGETWRVWGDEFHAVYIGERKLRSTTSSWSNLEVWTSSPWLRCQEQRLHKGWRRCHKTLGWCKKLQLVEHVPSLGMGVQLRCSGAGTGTGSRLITLLGWWGFFPPEVAGEMGDSSVVIFGAMTLFQQVRLLCSTAVLSGCALRKFVVREVEEKTFP